MMTGVVARAWQAVKPHIALIKFRGGTPAPAPAPQVIPVVVAAAPSASGGSKPNYKAVQAPIIHDWQLPAKYRRAPLSDKEVDYINRGGPE